MPEVQTILGRQTAPAAAAQPAGTITPGALRRIKILADLNDAQLSQLMEFLEPLAVPAWTVVVKQGEDGEAMYLVLGGELRARILAGGKETLLATFGPGEFFGDMALFDRGPRSADVVANADSLLLRLSSTAFERLTKEFPALATPFLQATARTLSARIRADNKRLDRLRQQFSSSGAGEDATMSADMR
jgi:CRP-like cAMP-binding protein